VSNEMIRLQTGMTKLEVILLTKRILISLWLGHVHKMDDNRISKQSLNWSPVKTGRRKRGRSRENWKTTV